MCERLCIGKLWVVIMSLVMKVKPVRFTHWLSWPLLFCNDRKYVCSSQAMLWCDMLVLFRYFRFCRFRHKKEVWSQICFFSNSPCFPLTILLTDRLLWLVWPVWPHSYMFGHMRSGPSTLFHSLRIKECLFFLYRKDNLNAKNNKEFCSRSGRLIVDFLVLSTISCTCGISGW